MQQDLNSGDRELIKRLSTGEEQAFRLVFERYRSKLYYFVQHIVEDESAAEELVQDVFLRIWSSRLHLASVTNLDSYLFTTARNRCLDHVRTRSSENAMKAEWSRRLELSITPTEEEYDFTESKNLIEKAVNMLPAQQALVFRLSKEQGLKRREIAQKLNLSENTVRNHLLEAIKSIRKYLGQHGDMALLVFIWMRL